MEKSGAIGFKPRCGLALSRGIIPVSREQDVVGPITRTVKDAALILDGITSDDKGAGYYAQSCSTTDLHGVRIGVIRDPARKVDEAKLDAFEITLNRLQTAGATIVEDIQLADLEEYNNPLESLKTLVLDTEFKVSIEAYLRGLAVNPRGLTTLDGLIDAIKDDLEEHYPSRNVVIMKRALTTSVGEPSYREMLTKQKCYANSGGCEGEMT